MVDDVAVREAIAALDLSAIEGALVEVSLSNLTTSSSIDITNRELMDVFAGALYVKVKREFKASSSEGFQEEIESISLEKYFLSHIAENVEDEAEQERLLLKASELFKLYEESDDDTL